MRSFVVSLFLAAALAAPAPKFRVEWDESTGRPVERLGSADEAACGFSCLHGAVMDSGSCTCICPKDKFWVGKVCDKCSLRDEDCLHGRLDRASCKCTECAAPWKGEFCDECGLDSSTCAHNGDMDPVTCACRNCDAPWGGKTCSGTLPSGTKVAPVSMTIFGDDVAATLGLVVHVWLHRCLRAQAVCVLAGPTQMLYVLTLSHIAYFCGPS